MPHPLSLNSQAGHSLRPDPPPPVRACRDAFDIAFLHLAVAGKANVLVSGDKDLLALAGARGLCPIMTVDEFCKGVLRD